jgi:hypothetical protein
MRPNLKLVIVACAILTLNALPGLVQAQEQNTNPGVDMPFIDRDGDGINDLLQHGWGFRFLERYKKRQLVWEQLKVEIIHDEQGAKVDTDGDGVGDISVHDFLKEKMNELIDTNGDGTADTPLSEYLGHRFKAFDRDGDGLPDDISKEEMLNHMKEMQNWRNEVEKRVHDGKPVFVDENNDGIPDNLPEGFGWRGLPGKRP